MSGQKQELVEVTLAKPHTHAGTPHQAGERIQVNPVDRDWLAANGIIESLKAKEGGK